MNEIEYEKRSAMGGFGGATRAFIESKTYAEKYRSDRYWDSKNGLGEDEKKALFETTDLEAALRTIAKALARVLETADEPPTKLALQRC